MVEAAAGAPSLSGASLPVNMTGPQASWGVQPVGCLLVSSAGRLALLPLPPQPHLPPPSYPSCPQLVRSLLAKGKEAGFNVMRTWAHSVNPQYAVQASGCLAGRRLAGRGMVGAPRAVGWRAARARSSRCCSATADRTACLCRPSSVLQTAPGRYNEAALRGLDYLLDEARKAGIRVRACVPAHAQSSLGGLGVAAHPSIDRQPTTNLLSLPAFCPFPPGTRPHFRRTPLCPVSSPLPPSSHRPCSSSLPSPPTGRPPAACPSTSSGPAATSRWGWPRRVRSSPAPSQHPLQRVRRAPPGPARQG